MARSRLTRAKSNLMSEDFRGDIPQIIENTGRLYEGDLVEYFRSVFFEASNLQNPYHNFRHMLHVMWLCYDACRYYRDQLTPRQMRTLLVAALFHDFDHPGHPHPGEEDPDRINIAIAVAALRRRVVPADAASLREIEALIEATHFPYRVPGHELELPRQIIRDADLAQVFSQAWIQQVVIGLGQEQGVAPIDVLKYQTTFLRRLTFSTEWAQHMFPAALIEAKIAEAEQLVRILQPPAAPRRAGGKKQP